MFISNQNMQMNPWDFLQEPTHSFNGNGRSIWLLLSAMDLGWQLDKKVMYCSNEGTSQVEAYCFLFYHPAGEQVQLITTPVSLRAKQFILENGLRIINQPNSIKTQ